MNSELFEATVVAFMDIKTHVNVGEDPFIRNNYQKRRRFLPAEPGKS